MEAKTIEELITKEFKVAQGAAARVVSGVSTDTRTLNFGELYVAIKGEQFDGHTFIADAVKKGAAAVLVSNTYEIPEWLHRHEDITVITIFDTVYGLGEIARQYRADFQVPVIGITGSNGKTSTKDMISAILNQQDSVTRTIGNLNNLIGVPLTLFRVNDDTGFVVAEMGMSQLGEIRRLTEIVNPDIGIITNIGESHLEFLGSLDNVAKGKREMIEMMTEADTAIVNADDIFMDKLVAGFPGKILTFGINSPADFKAENVRLDRGGTEFTVQGLAIKMNVAGYHFVYNALSAIAAARQLGISDQQIQTALAGVKLSPMRMELIASRDYMFINDSYNANPRSMKAALHTFTDIPLTGRRVVIFGDMLELGPQCVELHTAIGREIDRKKIDYVITFGDLAAFIAAGARQNGLNPDRVSSFTVKEECIAYLKTILQPGDNILVKGSRGMKMEEIIDALTRDSGRGPGSAGHQQ